MSVHEKGVDFYIDLLHKGQLDENFPVTNMEKTISYFETIFPCIWRTCQQTAPPTWQTT